MHAAPHRGPVLGQVRRPFTPSPLRRRLPLDLGHRPDLGLLFLDLVWTCPRIPFLTPSGPRTSPE
eukprot:6328730-Pyramimonas_sp.AAC.1